MSQSKGVAESVVEAVKAIPDRLSLSTILKEGIDEVCHQTGKGATELAAALFRDSSAFVMYPRENNEPNKGDVEQQQAPPEQERGGREM